jgi:hypothetical protein
MDEVIVRSPVRLYDLFRESPAAALELVLSAADKTYWKHKTMKCSLLGTRGSTSYGSYSKVSRQSLIGRSFIIEYWDGFISLYWTDVLHNEDWEDAMLNGRTVPNFNNLRDPNRLFKFEVKDYQCPS